MGSLLSAEVGSFASCTTPTYSEWSVTPIQSRGVVIWMSGPGSLLTPDPAADAWEFVGLLGWKLSERWSLRAGYKAVAFDRDEIDLTFHGPVMAVDYRF